MSYVSSNCLFRTKDRPRRVQPSLRDFSYLLPNPTLERVGYSRISLREMKAANRSKLHSAWRDEKKVFIRCGPIPLKTAGNQKCSEILCRRISKNPKKSSGRQKKMPLRRKLS